MKKNGFTLVELLAVIVILAIIMVMVTINVAYFSNKRKEDDYEKMKTLIVENTKQLLETGYIDEVDSAISNSSSKSCIINYSNLVSRNLMNDDTKNPINNKPLSTTCVKIMIDENTYKYNYTFLENCSGIPNCLSN